METPPRLPWWARPDTWFTVAAHGVTILLIFTVIVIVRAMPPVVQAAPAATSWPVASATPEVVASDTVPVLAGFAPEVLTASGGEAITRLADPHTSIPERPRYEIQEYTVIKGDTLNIIAKKFNLDPETLLWANTALQDNPNILSVGMKLNILPIDGALRVVQPGDTLENIAKVFHGKVEEIIKFPFNELDADNPQLKEGQYIIIPGGWREPVSWELPIPVSTNVRRVSGVVYGNDPGACAGPFSGVTGTYTFVYPAVQRRLSGTDYLPNGHPGLDFAAGMGSPIYASDSGVIIFAGWNTRGYGNLVMIDHGNGWQTVYAHLSQINVVCGQSIYQGQILGLAGSTGNSTGAHLHFEMRHSEYGRVNPWLYLPAP